MSNTLPNSFFVLRSMAQAIINEQKTDLESACQLVREAGLTTGHAGTCTELVQELLRDVAERRAKIEELELDVSVLKILLDRDNQAQFLMAQTALLKKYGLVAEDRPPARSDQGGFAPPTCERCGCTMDPNSGACSCPR